MTRITLTAVAPDRPEPLARLITAADDWAQTAQRIERLADLVAEAYPGQMFHVWVSPAPAEHVPADDVELWTWMVTRT